MVNMLEESIRHVNYNAILPHAVKAIKEFNLLANAQQMQIDELKQQLRTFC